MNEVQCFYEKLYKSRDVEDCEINELISVIPELSEASPEGEITTALVQNVFNAFGGKLEILLLEL